MEVGPHGRPEARVAAALESQQAWSQKAPAFPCETE